MLWRRMVDDNGFFDPWKEIERIHERMNRLLSAFTWDIGGEYPPVNVYVNSDHALVTTEVPGLEAGDIEISISGKNLTIRGDRKADELKEGESYHRHERWSGRFSRTIELPFNVEADKVGAKFSKGILSITLPRAEAERPKKIEIRAE